MYLIYQIKSWNGKVYIGQTSDKNFSNRISQHKYATSDMHISRAIRKHGWENFSVSVLERGLSAEQVDERERYYIALGDYTNPRYGYNSESGGNKNKKHSDETRRKMSKAHTGRTFSEETRRKMSKAHTGKIVSEETRRKISESNKGKTFKDKTFSEEHKQKLSEAHLGMPKLAFHIRINLLLRGGWSIRKISRVFGYNRRTISKYKDYTP